MSVDFSEYFDAPSDYHPPEDTELDGSTEFPNLNSIEFRNRQCDTNIALLPFYELLEANEDQSTILLATNSYSQRLWDGRVFGYERFADIGKSGADLINLSFDSNVTGMRFMDKTMVLFTTARGSLQLWSTQSEIRQKNGYNLFQVSKKTEHYGMITAFTVLKTNTKKMAVTGSTDGCLKVWKVAPCDLITDRTYQLAHREVITDVTNKPKSSDLLATCSRDRFLSIWDVRSHFPLVGTHKNDDFANTSCLWTNTTGIEMLYLGDDTGTLYMYDPRKLRTFLSKITLFDRPIYKFKLNPSGKRLCVLSQSNTLKVISMPMTPGADTTIYTNSTSKDNVRDICWVNGKQTQQDTFYSIGWSKQVGQHSIEQAS